MLLGAEVVASTRGNKERAEREGMLAEAQRLLDERAQKQQDLDRAVSHPATRHTAAASGAQPGEPLELFSPRAVRRTLLELGVEQGVADQLVRIERENADLQLTIDGIYKNR